MGLWRDFLRLLGLSGDARVHISAPGIDVVITGEPEQVRALLGVVKYELERSARWRDRVGGPPAHEVVRRPAATGAGAPAGGTPASPVRSSQFVQPTELDEMDSPYALPDPLVMPVEDTTGERERPSPGVVERTREPENGKAEVEPQRFIAEAATLVPDMYETNEASPSIPPLKPQSRIDARPTLARNESPPQEVKATRIDSQPPVTESSETDEGEREVTAIAPNPSGPVASPPATPPHSSASAPAILRSSSPFHTDGGPTLTPSISDSGVQPLEPVRKPGELRTTDPDADETKETSRRES